MSSVLPLNPTDLGIILTYHCQCACAHCLYNCGPGWSDWMSFESVESAMQATMAWKQPVRVRLTGGEPFLNYPLLLHAVQVASRMQISCYAETNAGWCVQGDLVADRFLQLRDNGLQAILISCSPFHAAVIPLKRTLLAIAVALEVFGSDRVMVYMVEWLDQLRRFGFDDAIPLDQYIESYGAGPTGVMFWQGYSLVPGGRSGFHLGHLTHRQQVSAFQGENCRPEIVYPHRAQLDLYGNIIPSYCGGLTPGRWENIPQLREDFKMDGFSPLIAILVDSGPFGLFTFARDQHGYRPLRSGYVGKCHLCVDVRRHLAKFGGFVELKPHQFYESI